jgi:hypothetical protein
MTGHVLSIAEVCMALRLSRSAFYRRQAQLVAAGVLVEALPRFGHPKYLAAPVAAYVSGDTRRAVLRAQLRRSA